MEAPPVVVPLLAVACHVVWGLQPVLTRYLQTRTELSAASVMCATQSASLCVSVAASLACPSTTTEKNDWSRRKWWTVAVVYGLVTTCRLITNFLSAGLAASWNVALVSTLGPFVTAAVARCFLGEVLDARAWPSLVVAAFGACLVGWGEASSRQHVSSVVAGVLLQVVSLIFSGLARTAMKWTDGHYAPRRLMTIQYVTVIAVTLAATLGLQSQRRDLAAPWLRLDWRAWVAAVALAVCIQWAASEAQIVLVRRAGPALYTSFQPLRLVSTLAFGALVLRESAVGLREWLGLAVVVAAVATFLFRRARWPLSPRRGGDASLRQIKRAELVPVEEALADDDGDTSLGVVLGKGDSGIDFVDDDLAEAAPGTIVVLPEEPRPQTTSQEEGKEEHRFFFATAFSPTGHSGKTKKKNSSSDLLAAATLEDADEERSAQQYQLLRKHSRLRLIT